MSGVSVRTRSGQIAREDSGQVVVSSRNGQTSGPQAQNPRYAPSIGVMQSGDGLAGPSAHTLVWSKVLGRNDRRQHVRNPVVLGQRIALSLGVTPGVRLTFHREAYNEGPVMQTGPSSL
mgnify:CR=1 FL=1